MKPDYAKLQADLTRLEEELKTERRRHREELALMEEEYQRAVAAAKESGQAAGAHEAGGGPSAPEGWQGAMKEVAALRTEMNDLRSDLAEAKALQERLRSYTADLEDQVKRLKGQLDTTRNLVQASKSNRDDVLETLAAQAAPALERLSKIAGAQDAVAALKRLLAGKTPATSSPVQPARGGRAAEIVVISPDIWVLTMLNALATERVHVQGVSNGAQGLAQIRETPPDLVVMDLDLPDLDGWQVLHNIKTSPQTKHLPVAVMMTAGNRKRMHSLGIHGYLQRPAAEDRISEVVERLGRPLKQALLVDDQPDDAGPFDQVVSAHRGALTKAAGSDAAMEWVRNWRPDLVFIDTVMPRVNGFEVLEWLRSRPETKTTPVVLLAPSEVNAEELEAVDGDITVFLERDDAAGPEEILSKLRILAGL